MHDILFVTSTRFSAQDAMDMGLVNKVLPPAQLMPEALKMARRPALTLQIAAFLLLLAACYCYC